MTDHTMTIERKTVKKPDQRPSRSTGPTFGIASQTLIRVLDRGEQIRDAVEEGAVELPAVNSTRNQEWGEQPRPPALEAALEQNEAVEGWMQACADDLSTVNAALKSENRERHVLERQLRAAQLQERAARHAAFRDPLTSLPNRGLFNDRLEHGLIKAQRSGGSMAVMFIDLDDFKGINETHGHAAGDAVLRTVASRLTAMTRGDDTVSRHGGDEFFCLLLELKNEADAIPIADKILRSMVEPCIVCAQNSDRDIGVNVRLSIGIAIVPWDGNTAEALINSADRAMYRAKQNRSGYAFDR